MMTKEEIKNIVLNNKQNYHSILKQLPIYPELLLEIEFFTINLNLKGFSKKLYHYINNMYGIPICKSCKENNTKFISIIDGYKKYCCQKCAFKDKDFISNRSEKRKEYSFSKIYDEKKKVLLENGSKLYSNKNDFKDKLNSILSENNFANMERILIKNYSVEWQSLYNFSKIKSGSFFEVLYCFLYDIKEVPKCNICGKNIKFRNFKEGYPICCSRKCHTIYYNIDKTKLSFEKIEKNVSKRGYDLLVTKEEYLKNKKIIIKCKKGHIWEPTVSSLYKDAECNKCKCGYKSSSQEKEITKFLSENNTVIIENTKKLIPPYEIDIYLPEYNLAIEFDGLYWHSERHGKKGKGYHLNKTNRCREKGIQLVHIFENEWLKQKEIVKSILLNKIGKFKEVIYSGRCVVKNVSLKHKKLFLQKNHIQGDCDSSINIGLYHSDELISIMCFNEKGQGNWDILRFCDKLNTQVLGSENKLFQFFINNHDYSEIKTYHDKRYYSFYEKTGFKLIKESGPNCFYINNGILENIKKHGCDKIWDCGNYVYSHKKYINDK